MNHEAKEFILSVLKEWELRFKGIRLAYAYDAGFNCHIIEVEPNEVFSQNDEYARAELQLWESFAERFTDDEILICEPDSRNDMSMLIYKTQSSSDISTFGLAISYTPIETKTRWDEVFKPIRTKQESSYKYDAFGPIKCSTALMSGVPVINESSYAIAA